MAGENSFNLAAEAASKASELTGKMLMDEVKDCSAVMETISRTISSLQAIIRDGRDADGVSFPEELGMKKKIRKLILRKFTFPGMLIRRFLPNFSPNRIQ